MNEQLATTEQVADFLQMDAGTLRKWRMRGIGPTAYMVGNKARYDMTEVRQWVGMSKVVPIGFDAAELDDVLSLLSSEPGGLNPIEAADWLAQSGEGWIAKLQQIRGCAHGMWDEHDENWTCTNCGVTPELVNDLDLQIEFSHCGHILEDDEARKDLVDHAQSYQVDKEGDIWSCAFGDDDPDAA